MNNDLISREALKTTIDKFIGYLDEDMIERIKIAIDNAPTVEQRPHGKWEDKSIYEQFGNPPRNFIRSEEFRCSNCQNLPVKTIVNGCLVFCLTEFCPNCGADMRGES